MELLFMGSGGGRVVLDRQLLATGGFRINSEKFKMHADPGPGAFLKSFEHKQKLTDLNALFVSHAHIDHCNDANMLIEAMNFGNFKGGKGTLLASESVINGYEKFEKQIDEYFKKMLQSCRALKPAEVHTFSESISLIATRTKHEDPSAIGFILNTEGLKLGYTADTEKFEGISKEYEGCDFLIINCLRPDDDKLEYHLTSQDVISTINDLRQKPRAIFITHLGMKFLKAGKELQRKFIESATGVRTIIAEDGRKFDLNEMKVQTTL